MLNIAAQTIVHENAPPHMRGRVFATQLAVASGLSVLPLLFLGEIADLAVYLAGATYTTGQAVVIDGGWTI